MKAPAAHALRWAACLCVIGFIAVATRPARAQSAPEPAYEDRLISGGALKPDISAGDYLSPGDTTGLARSVRVDAVASVLSQSGPNAAPTAHEDGIVADAQWETSVYGAWSADLAARIGGSDEQFVVAGDDRTSFSLHQRDMPFDGGWQADNGLGDLNTPLINLARMQPRFMLTSGAMVGAETEWRGPSGAQIVAGGGEPGVFEGIRVPTFQTLGGSTATLGAQWSPAPGFTVGGEYAGARDANIYYQPPSSTLLPPDISNDRISSNTGLLSGAWQDGGTHAQLNLIDGTLDGNNNALGVWADGSHTQGGYTQSFGAFRIDPNLAWGNQLIASDVQGGYYRLGYQSRRWVADFGVDEVLSVSGHGPDSTFLNGDARYQLSRDTGIGGVANVLLSHDGTTHTAWSVEGYLDNTNGLGTGRVQLDYADDSQTQDAILTLQQSWNMSAGTRLSTSAGVEHIQSVIVPGIPAAGDSTIVRVAAYGGGNLTSRFSVDGSVQWADAVSGRAAPYTSADVSLNYQINRSWGVIFTYYENRIGSWTPLVVTSPLTPPVPVPTAAEGQRGVFLTLRYQYARGGHFVPLGGAAGAGSGRLTGVVYLDANENGRYDAGEAGAPNVTVILDGRFSTRTDANGRFDFPAVVAGHHVLTVQNDNLPLPWTLVNQGRTEVDVATRDRVDVNIAAVRLK
jgi:SdrD B-like domain